MLERVVSCGYAILIDPEDRSRLDGECVTRKMTPEEVAKYGQPSGKKGNSFLFKQSDIVKSLMRRGLKPKEKRRKV